MSKFIDAFFMAWGMFCAIPCPCKRWNDTQRPKMILFLPVIGLILGLIWCAAALLLGYLDISGLFGAAVLTIIPYLLTGFIHLDGYMDCCDAILSRRDLPERQRILKDSTVGAFAVICICILMLLTAGAFSACTPNVIGLSLLFIPVISRGVSGIAVNRVAPIGHSSYAGSYATGVKKSYSIVLAGMVILAVGASIAVNSWYGLSAIGTLLGSTFAIFSGTKNLGGMSGDISGFGITIGEAAGIVTLAVIGGIA